MARMSFVFVQKQRVANAVIEVVKRAENGFSSATLSWGSPIPQEATSKQEHEIFFQKHAKSLICFNFSFLKFANLYFLV